MENLNTQILDLITLRSLTLEKVQNGLSNDVKKVYKSIFDDLITRIKEEDNINSKNLNAIIRELKERIDPNLTLFVDLQELAIQEASYITMAINGLVGAELFKKIPTDSTILKIANTSLFNGATAMKTFEAFDRTQKNIIEKEIKQAVYNGETVADIRNRLVNKGNIAINQSETLARTFTANVVNQVRNEVYEENSDVLKGYMHTSTFDTRTSNICLSRSGLRWTIERKPINHSKPFRNPPLHYRCRSVIVPITKSYKELGLDVDEIGDSTKASMDGQIPESVTMTKWLKSKPKETVEEILGKGRAELFLDGKITLSDLVNQNGEVLSLKQLKALR